MILVVLPTLTVSQSFNSKGKPHKKVANKTSEPKHIVDTVTVMLGKGVLELNSNFTQGKHNVSATKAGYIYGSITQLIVDTSETVYSWSYLKAADGKSITIKSSGTNTDTCLVVVNLFIK